MRTMAQKQKVTNMSYFDFNYDAEKAVEKDTLGTGMRIRDTDVYQGIIS